ncbi:4'-phosphopantetheinyl transferase [Neorhizobium huautlense]|uniref:4'-phosphopantetheinyl transferase n=1 Tax=Neorhizobium huautlense TaxID=67774 RepID=A0ABT9PPS4_9HYPH|nr:4'-phosphopantetheinyl transferase superfamily protein [Neorhizobium huautlense]MDP9835689.1 4'-phosphopantetheinyl transferase [Neorhizobium huautlense]
MIAVTVQATLEALAGEDVLDDAEKAQAARFVRAEDGRRYRAAHLLKRHLLGMATDLPPQDLRFGRHDGGKPFLLGERGPDFNISHGGDWVIAGFSWSGRIGVDVEAERPIAFWREIASSFLSTAELAVADGGDFLKIWTAKEAGLKAHGAGFAIMPNAITVAGEGDGFALTIDAMNLGGLWHRLDEAHMLGLAASGEPPQIAVCRSADDLDVALCGIRPPVPGLPASR